MTEKQKRLCLTLLKRFIIDGKNADIIATEGQINIFGQIIFRENDRVQIITPTQYGKSLFVALAAIIVSCIQGKEIAIIAPKVEKARIIMRYYIEHLGDSELFYSQLEKDTKLERLMMEESKQRIALRNSGGIFVLSANASNSVKGFESSMGSGAEICILDEASLIPDDIEATIFRMIAGKKDAFYCKIGNPFYRNHFLKSWNDERYHKIFINAEQGLSEGRYTKEFLDEAKLKPHYNVLFNCKFPDADAIDAQGYSQLIKETDIRQSVIQPFGELRMGVDVAEDGGNYNVIVLRWANYAKVALKYQTSDTMDLCGRVIQLAKDLDILDRNIFIDSIGVGKGVVDRLYEQRWNVNAVKVSEKAGDEYQFTNLRSENYWKLRKWLPTATLEPHKEWYQLSQIKYKVRDSSGKLMIMPKDEMRKQGIESPDVADALALTFSRDSIINRDKILTTEQRELVKQFDYFKSRDKLKRR
jgi:hypothetical protein